MSNCHQDDDSTSSVYEPEYDLENVVVIPNVVELGVMTVLPPPLEWLSSLHTARQEISGRQVWTGSLFLAQVLYHVHQDDNSLLNGKR